MSEFLNKWQTLIGAFLGGIFAFGVAFIVAYQARRHDETAAAMLLISNLTAFMGAAETLDGLAEAKNVQNDEMPRWITAKILWARPTLSPLFEASMMRVTRVDEHLAAHLSLFQMIYNGMEVKIKKLSLADQKFRETGNRIMSNDEMISTCKTIKNDFQMATEHARCATLLLERLFLGNTALFHRLIRYIRKPKSENECIKLLKKGEL